ncbi:MAG: hypothetical protein E7218_05085 [Anaerofustis stercorihominis]|nr:hypothetical protein [Anaerofustis stercorihominis]
MQLNEILNALTDNITPFLLFLTAVAGIIDSSTKISAKPLTSFFKWIGGKLNADMSEKFDALEAYFLNDFYQRHINGENLTREQYELAINMFEKHLVRGANSVNRLHLEVLREYYKSVYM